MGLTPIYICSGHTSREDTKGVGSWCKGDMYGKLNDMGTVSSVKVHCLCKLHSDKGKVAVMSPYIKHLYGFMQ